MGVVQITEVICSTAARELVKPCFFAVAFLRFVNSSEVPARATSTRSGRNGFGDETGDQAEPVLNGLSLQRKDRRYSLGSIERVTSSVLHSMDAESVKETDGSGKIAGSQPELITIEVSSFSKLLLDLGAGSYERDTVHSGHDLDCDEG